MAHLTITLYEDDYKAIKRVSRMDGVSVSEIVRNLIERYLDSIGEAPYQKDQSWRFKNWD